MTRLHHVGIDVHKETMDVLVYREGEQHVFLERTIPNREKTVKKLFGKLLEEGLVIACYEAGCMGFGLQRLLAGMGVRSIVVAPGKVPRRVGDRVKTDRRDARRLAQQLRAGTLEAIHIPSEGEEAVRDYLRAREDVRLELKKTKQRIHRFLLRHGYVYESTRYWTLRHDRWLRSLEFERSMLKETFDEYYYMMKGLTEKLRLMDKRIEEIALSEPYAEKVQKLRCLKGIDYLTALSIVCEVGDFRRFRHAEAFMAYLGLVPRDYSSGEKRRQGGITKTGNTHLRNLLIESSWHYRYKSVPGKRLTERREGQAAEIIAYADRAMRRLQEKFFRLILKGKTKQAAVTAVARELAGFVWGMMVGQTL
jgi:transposase